MLKKKSSSSEKKRKHSQSEERRDGSKHKSVDSKMEVRKWRKVFCYCSFSFTDVVYNRSVIADSYPGYITDISDGLSVMAVLNM